MILFAAFSNHFGEVLHRMIGSFGRFANSFCREATCRLAIGNRCAVLHMRCAPSGAFCSTGPLIAFAVRKSPKGADHDYDR